MRSAEATDATKQCADKKAVLVPDTGTYHRPIHTASKEAQLFFDQGLRLTYSYYFPEAVASFDAALCFDPTNPMIHWGRALAIGPNPNSRYARAPDDPRGLGKDAIAQARATKGDDLSAEDGALIDALAVLFDTSTYPDQAARSSAFIDATQDLYRRFPKDLEAAFLAADAIMMASPWAYWSAQDGSPIGLANTALAILETGIAQDPLHPGLTHLHIHLLENSQMPERAESSADRLESLTPRAGHMVHMPGHIYMRIGRYEDAVLTNERSLEADKYFMTHWGDRPLPAGTTLGISARVHGPHARDFIQWASLLLGDSARAVGEAKTMAGAASAEMLSHGMGMRSVATYWTTLRAFGRWQDILAIPAPPESQPYLQGIRHYVRGSAWLATGNVPQAELELTSLERVSTTDSLRTQRASTNTAADLLRIAQRLLQGELAAARGDHPLAIEHFRAAVAAQDQLRYMEPADWMHSTRLYLGQALIEAGRLAEAEVVFREDLQLLQENGWALHGLLQSLRGQGKPTADVETRLTKAWAKADVQLPGAHF